MTPISQLSETLKALASPEHYLFTLSDLSSALPQRSHDALQRNMPMQRINIDICAIPSYEPKPMLLRNLN